MSAIFPILETSRLRLRELTPADAPALLRIHSDAETMRWFGVDPMQSVEEAERIIDAFNGWFVASSGIRWGLELRDHKRDGMRGSDRLIGTCGLLRWNKNWRHCALGYELARDCHGQGYMREALTEVLNFGECLAHITLSVAVARQFVTERTVAPVLVPAEQPASADQTIAAAHPVALVVAQFQAPADAAGRDEPAVEGIDDSFCFFDTLHRIDAEPAHRFGVGMDTQQRWRISRGQFAQAQTRGFEDGEDGAHISFLALQYISATIGRGRQFGCHSYRYSAQ